LVLSFYELAQKIDGLHLYIGGDPRPQFKDYYEALQSLIRRLNLQDRVTIDGLVTDSAEWYRKIDIFISNSYSEGLQVSPMEAIASGCFCLSHNWDGAEELLPRENIYFTGSELQEKIIKYHFLSNADKSRESASLRGMVAQRFDVDKTKIEILQLLEEVGQSDPQRTKISA
jgi:glycosyltransferase involved in cell wall biosynthesis